MGILTNFLKLLKPEPNDFVDVAKHISENYDKLDKNAEATNRTLTNLSNNKLDKGTYPGDASDLNTEISKVASKTTPGRMIIGKGMIAYSNGQASIVSEDDGIIVNTSDIKLNIVDNLKTNSSTRSLSAKQGKKLSDEKQDITDTALPTASKTITGSIKELFTGKINTTDIVNNLTTAVPGKVLDGRQGPAIVNKINGLAGGYSGAFPLTTAVKEGIYLLPATNKFYVCIKNYSGSSLTAPNANFEELSVFQNRNKLENLCEILTIDGWIILKNSNGLLELFKKVDIKANASNVSFELPIRFIDKKTAVGSLISIHTGTDGFRAYDLSIFEDKVDVRVYSSNTSFTPTCNIWLKGFWK